MVSILIGANTYTERKKGESIKEHIERHDTDAFFNEVIRVECLNAQVTPIEEAQK